MALDFTQQQHLITVVIVIVQFYNEKEGMWSRHLTKKSRSLLFMSELY